jgi:hypothetical protein
MRHGTSPAYLEGALECSHQNGKEKKGSTTVETGSGVLKIVENTTNDQSHCTLSQDTGEEKTHVTCQSLETTPDAQLDLHGD